MAFQPTFKYYLIEPQTGNYFYATQNKSGVDTWDIFTSVAPVPLGNLPQGWDNFTLQWVRNMKYIGVFRNQTTTFKYANDGRAILKMLLFGGQYNPLGGGVIDYPYQTGMQALCQLQIFRVKQSDWTYEMVYECNINFEQAKDDEQNRFFSAPSLDSNLREKLQAYENTAYNVPFWKTLDSGATWNLDTGVYPVENQRVKLLFQQRFTTGATVAHHVLQGIQDVSGGADNHTEFSVNALNLVQANGSNTIIGNHLLEKTLIIGTQTWRSSDSFDCFNTNSYNLWNLTGADTAMVFSAQFIMELTYPNPDPAGIQYPTLLNFMFWNLENSTTGSGTPSVVGSPQIFGTFIISNNPGFAIGDNITVSLAYETQNKVDIPNQILNDTYVIYSPNLSEMTIARDCMQVIGMQSNIVSGVCTVDASDLDFYVYSQPSYSGTAVVSAPSLPPSPCLGFRPLDLFKKLVPNLFTTKTDAYGFPDQGSLIDYNGESAKSTFLLDDTLDPNRNFDSIPYRTIFTSGNSLRNISGIDYMNISLSEAFNTCANLWSVGLGIETTLGVDNVIIEPLIHFFKDTLLLDLGDDVYGIEVTPMTEFAGNNLKVGFGERPANQDYGIDSFCVKTEFSIYVTRVVKDIDNTIATNVDMYQIEFGRAEQNSKDQSSANSNNQTFAIALEKTTFGSIEVIDPNGTSHLVSGWKPRTPGNTVQNTVPTTAPYVNGLLFPDTAVNMGFSPKRCLLRNGAWFHSVLDGMDATYLTFRKQYQMLFNQASNTYAPQPYPSMESNLGGGIVKEASDVLVSDLQSRWGTSTVTKKLFRPFIIKVITKQPLNMYQIMGSSPIGYVRCVSNGKLYRGFIMDVTQKVGNEAATTFNLLAHPNQVF